MPLNFFFSKNNLAPETESTTQSFKVTMLMYYAYTTLSTVGLGDLNPRSDWERAICVPMLILGVAIFGIIMSRYLEIIDKFKQYDAEHEEGDALN